MMSRGEYTSAVPITRRVVKSSALREEDSEALRVSPSVGVAAALACH